MHTLTNAELKIQETVTRVRNLSSDVVFELKDGRTVDTQLLIDVIEAQSGIMQSLLDGFLEVCPDNPKE